MATGITRSGYNEAQYLNDALALYKEQKWNKKKSSFKLLHCWNILKNEPKWESICHRKEPPKSLERRQPPSPVGKRPVGTKKAKFEMSRASEQAKFQMSLVAAMEEKNHISQSALDARIFSFSIGDPNSSLEAEEYFRLRRQESLIRARISKIKAERELETLVDYSIASDTEENTCDDSQVTSHPANFHVVPPSSLIAQNVAVPSTLPTVVRVSSKAFFFTNASQAIV
ncbi:hypothetical protein AC1031_016669 [Aphanomyces cochlioides]|nr:hypothetical protein AC1031_016669 [Aphanomyces cochlioides]